jgi:hypothetical protein
LDAAEEVRAKCRIGNWFCVQNGCDPILASVVRNLFQGSGSCFSETNPEIQASVSASFGRSLQISGCGGFRESRLN